MDDDFERLQHVLDSGEHMLWYGRPDPSVIFTKADAFLIPLYLVVIAFGVVWTVRTQTGASDNTPALQLVLTILGVAFIAVGLFFSVGRFLVKTAAKRRTIYGLTTRRAIVVKGHTPGSAELAGGTRAVTTSRDNRHMSVTFGNDGAVGIAGPGSGSVYRVVPNAGLDFLDFAGTLPIAFYDVADVDGLTSALEKMAPAK